MSKNITSAETLAIQTLLAHIFEQLSQISSPLEAAIKRGFDHAASDVENISIAASGAAEAKEFTEALGIIEELRVATFGGQEKPKSGV
jgi:hypothetical protein